MLFRMHHPFDLKAVMPRQTRDPDTTPPEIPSIPPQKPDIEPSPRREPELPPPSPDPATPTGPGMPEINPEPVPPEYVPPAESVA
jgi:hypothetical protein